MKPVDSFFGGLRGAFRPDDDTGLIFLIVAAVLVVAALVGLLVRNRRRARAPAEARRRLIAERHLPHSEVATLDDLAAAGGVNAADLGTRLDLFEQATAAVFARQAPVLEVHEHDIFDRTRRLRQALGFANLPDHFPLLTTRELPLGAAIDFSGTPAIVRENNEAFLVAQVPRDMVDAVGTSLAAVVTRANDARYEFKLRLLASQVDQLGRRLHLGHDEAPARSQSRGYVRVSAHGPVRVRPLPSRIGPRATSNDEFSGQIVDISLGGMALHASTLVPAGVDVLVWFTFAEQAYKDVAALVLDCHSVNSTLYQLRLAFRDLPATDEQRLSASITAFTARPVVPESA